MGLGQYEQSARNPHHTLGRGAARRGRKLAGVLSDVRPDDREIAVLHLPDVRAAVGSLAGQHRFSLTRAKAFRKHDRHLTIVRCLVNSLFR